MLIACLRLGMAGTATFGREKWPPLVIGSFGCKMLVWLLFNY